MTILELLQASGLPVFDADGTPPRFADTAKTITGYLQGVVGQSVYPLYISDDPEPAETAVYQPVRMEFLESDQHQIGRVDSYVISIRARTFTRLKQLSTAAVDAAVDQQGLEVRDAAADYEPDQKQCRAHLQLDALTLPDAVGAPPALFVYEQGAQATGNELDNAVHQWVTEQVAIVCVAPQSAMRGLRDQIASTLLGQQAGPYDEPYLYAGGQPLEQIGGLAFWREVYTWRRYLRA